MSTKAKRVKLVVAYDGYDFCGWAPQAEQRTVHGTLTEGLKRVTGKVTEIVGASRTDSGAHARGQVCHFDDTQNVPVENWVRALNDALPEDISVLSAKHVSSNFHSRFSAKDRWYRYRIQVGTRDPHRSRCVYRSAHGLDLEAMQDAAKHYVGRHDFLAVSQSLPVETNTVRLLHSVKLSRVKDEIRLDVVGQAFVRGMMRRIAGSLLEVGLNRREPDSIAELLLAKSRVNLKYPVLLPAHGLCLMRIRYGRHPFDHRFLTTDRQENEEE